MRLRPFQTVDSTQVPLGSLGTWQGHPRDLRNTLDTLHGGFQAVSAGVDSEVSPYGGIDPGRIVKIE